MVLAVADGLGPDPARRLLIGLLLVLVSAAALWRRELMCASLRVRPWLVMPLAAAQLGAAIADGLIGGHLLHMPGVDEQQLERASRKRRSPPS